MDIQKFIEERLQEWLNNPKLLFEDDELAYLSLQGKNELQVRDKVAWRLQQDIDKRHHAGEYIVRREWSPQTRSKVDMAVLKVDENNQDRVAPIALIEFKAHSFVNQEQWPYAAFLVDVKKMYDMINEMLELKDDKGNPIYTNAHNVDMYFIFLQSTQNKKQSDGGGYKEAIAYVDILNHDNTICPATETDYTDYWKGFYDDGIVYNSFLGKKNSNPLSHFKDFYDKNNLSDYKSDLSDLINYCKGKPDPNKPKIQSVGTYLGYEWSVASFIWGPYKKDIDSKSNALIKLK